MHDDTHDCTTGIIPFCLSSFSGSNYHKLFSCNYCSLYTGTLIVVTSNKLQTVCKFVMLMPEG